MDENFARLSTEINEISVKNSEADLDRSMHSVFSIPYDNDISDKQDKLQKSLKVIMSLCRIWKLS